MPRVKGRGQKKCEWSFDGTYKHPIELDTSGELPHLKVEPWKVMDKVLDLWHENVDLIERNESFPWGIVYGWRKVET